MKHIFALLVLVAVVMLVRAQEPVEPRCAKEEIQTMLEIINGGTYALLEEVDMTTVWQSVSAMAGVHRQIYALCNPLFFEGTNQQLIGPITIPAGVYRAILTTEGFFAAKLEVLDGECEADGVFGLYLINAGQANDGAEVLVRSEGCETLIGTNNVTAEWTLEFEKIG
jgi:hypothetical protein